MLNGESVLRHDLKKSMIPRIGLRVFQRAGDIIDDLCAVELNNVLDHFAHGRRVVDPDIIKRGLCIAVQHRNRDPGSLHGFDHLIPDFHFADRICQQNSAVKAAVIGK